MDMLLDDAAIAERILSHIDNQTTDLGDGCWREPVANYRSEARLDLELDRVFRRMPVAYCPSVALAERGSYLAREAAGVPLVAVRGADGVVRAFRNACRHRGMQVACGSGRAASFVCPYHAWAYGLDGGLLNIPHEYGFPGLDKSTHGLVPVAAEERGGIVFVTQEPDGPGAGALDGIPDLIGPGLQMVSSSETIIEANWKVFAEGFLEGYHIYPTHRETFFPAQFDNLNLVEHFGRHSRVTYPYRNIQKLRAVDPALRRVAGTLTHVHHLFPNAIVATFPRRIVMNVLEPIGIAATRSITYVVAEPAILTDDRPGLEQDTDFVDRGAAEDRAMVESIQRGMASGANEVFEFGLFEAAIVHLHRNLHALIEDAA